MITLLYLASPVYPLMQDFYPLKKHKSKYLKEKLSAIEKTFSR